jgi:5'/3'-nucleotidase
MNILLTNDDGIYAPGIWALYKALTEHRHRVFVVAPDRERSAVGHGITLYKPLRATPVTVNEGYGGWAINGTPADCVKLAVVELLKARPDMVIAGINPGANIGISLSYSGTVAAAKEGAMYGIHSIAVSIQGVENPHYDTAAQFVAGLVPAVIDMALPEGTFLNVNVPDLPCHKMRGTRISRQSVDLFEENYEKRRDPRDRPYYWPGRESRPAYRHSDADGAVLADDCISITPVRCDMTDYTTLEKLESFDFDIGFRGNRHSDECLN